jgi:hypothetical protein
MYIHWLALVLGFSIKADIVVQADLGPIAKLHFFLCVEESGSMQCTSLIQSLDV